MLGRSSVQSRVMAAAAAAPTRHLEGIGLWARRSSERRRLLTPPRKMYINYITEAGLESIEQHKYKAAGYTWFDNFCNPMWMAAVNLLPKVCFANAMQRARHAHLRCAAACGFRAPPCGVVGVIGENVGVSGRTRALVSLSSAPGARPRQPWVLA